MKSFTLENVEEAFEEIEIEDSFLLEEDETHQIWLDTTFIRVHELNIDIYFGQYLNYDEDEQDYYPDFSIYVFKELGSNTVLYDEGYSSFHADVHNFTRANFPDFSKNILNLTCTIENKQPGE